MSIEKLYGGYTACCETCDNEEEAEDFMELVNLIKELGWKIRKVGDVWEHYCPDCANPRNRIGE